MKNVVGDQATSRCGVFDRVLLDNADRDPLPLALKLKVMAGSPFGFFQQWVEFCHEFKRRPTPSLAA